MPRIIIFQNENFKFIKRLDEKHADEDGDSPFDDYYVESTGDALKEGIGITLQRCTSYKEYPKYNAIYIYDNNKHFVYEYKHIGKIIDLLDDAGKFSDKVVRWLDENDMWRG